MSVQVKVTHAAKGEMPVAFKALGEFGIRLQTPAKVVSRISGIVTIVEVVEGQDVTAGDVLVRLDDRPKKNALARARAGLTSAESELTKADQGGLEMQQSDLHLAAKQAEVAAQQAREEVTRQATLLASHLTSQKEAILAQKQMEETAREANSATAKANLFRSIGREMERALLVAAVGKASAEVADAEIELEATVIRATQTGRLAGFNTGMGATVTAGAEIAQVVGCETTNIRLWAAPSEVREVSPGAKVTAKRSGQDNPFTGIVASIGGGLDPATGLVQLEAVLEGEISPPPRLGEVVLADVTTHEEVTGVLVPDSALVLEDDRALIYTVDGDSIAHAVPVKVLARNAASAIVAADGLAEGALVITDGNFNLPDGARVQTTQSP